MTNFVKIKQVYSENSDLNVSYLNIIYSNTALLVEHISALTFSTFSKLDICNKKVLIKPNWVTHSRMETDEFCLRTHNNFIIASLQVILQYKPKQITVGDAPIQGCNWDKMISKTLLKQIEDLSNEYNIPIIVKDFRRVSFDISTNNLIEQKQTLDNFIIFDVAQHSYLEPITHAHTQFRVTNYDSKNMANAHSQGVHKYCITKDLFDADLIITLPKIKTHQKTGLTNALKILVGINGDKDFLPHHRKGGSDENGDCYPGKNLIRKSAENLLDYSNKQRGKKTYKNLLRLSGVVWNLSNPGNEHNFAAGWYGNDTTWRMVLDINKIAEYGLADGTLSNKPQRVIYSLSDGIIAGQGDGPLTPTPLPLGVIAFSNNAAWMDIIAGKLMGMDINKIPLLINASFLVNDKICELEINDQCVKLDKIENICVNATMPQGWLNYKQK